MVIRPALPADLPGLCAIENAEIQGGVAHFGEVPVTLEEAQAKLAAARHPWLVADDGGIAGFVRCGPWKSREAYRFTCEIGVYVASEARGRGMGKALYAAVIPRLRAQGIHTVIAGIVLPNPASIRLHEGFGFEKVGVFPENGFKRGAWHDVGYWSLRL